MATKLNSFLLAALVAAAILRLTTTQQTTTGIVRTPRSVNVVASLFDSAR